jgi:hypothetical protein
MSAICSQIASCSASQVVAVVGHAERDSLARLLVGGVGVGRQGGLAARARGGHLDADGTGRCGWSLTVLNEGMPEAN